MLLTGQFPCSSQSKTSTEEASFSDSNNSNILRCDSDVDTVKGKTTDPDQVRYNSLSLDAQILLDDMLDEDPCNRPTITEILGLMDADSFGIPAQESTYDWLKDLQDENLILALYQEMQARFAYIYEGLQDHLSYPFTAIGNI